MQGSAEQATYVELCFPPPASFTMNGSQPCLNTIASQAAALPSNKVSCQPRAREHAPHYKQTFSFWDACPQIAKLIDERFGQKEH